MKDWGDLLERRFGDRRTSPMYKTFIISWCLWNWNFLYTLLFENSEHILQQKSILKNEYLKSFYHIDRNIVFSNKFIEYTFSLESGLRKSFIGPVMSVLIIFYIINKIEIKIRKQANKIKKEQLRTDNELLSIDIEKGELINQEKENELKGLKLELEKERELRNHDLETTKFELENMRAELEFTKNQIEEFEQKKFNNSELGLIDNQRNIEYNEATEIKGFTEAVQDLQLLINLYDKDERKLIFNKHASLYTIYNLCDNNYYQLTEKGIFFIRKSLLNKTVENIISPGDKKLFIEKIKENELPF